MSDETKNESTRWDLRSESALTIANRAIEAEREGYAARQKRNRGDLLEREKIAAELGKRLDSVESWDAVEDEILLRESKKKVEEMRKASGWYGEQPALTLTGKEQMALIREVAKKANLDLTKHNDFCKAEKLAGASTKIAFSLKGKYGTKITFSRASESWYAMAELCGFDPSELQDAFPNFSALDFVMWLKLQPVYNLP